MPLVEGIGDEVIEFFIALFVVVIGKRNHSGLVSQINVILSERNSCVVVDEDLRPACDSHRPCIRKTHATNPCGDHGTAHECK